MSKLKFAKDIILEPPVPTYRVSQQINPIICLVDTRKTQTLKKQTRSKQNGFESMQLILSFYTVKGETTSLQGSFNVIKRSCASRSILKYLKAERKGDWSTHLVVDRPVPGFGRNFIVLWFQATVPLQIRKKWNEWAVVLQSLLINIRVYKHTWTLFLNKDCFLTTCTHHLLEIVTMRTKNVLILLSKWKHSLGMIKGSILSFLFSRFSVTKDTHCISKMSVR